MLVCGGAGCGGVGFVAGSRGGVVVVVGFCFCAFVFRFVVSGVVLRFIGGLVVGFVVVVVWFVCFDQGHDPFATFRF